MSPETTVLEPPKQEDYVVVRIADMQISNDPKAILITHSLGSCLGLTIYDPVTRIGGMIHCMMPIKERALDPLDNPCRYVDSGVPLLINTLIARGVSRSRAHIYVAGCASRLDNQGMFKIGQRNYTVFRKILWKSNLLIADEDVGGSISRTVTLQIGSGEYNIRRK